MIKKYIEQGVLDERFPEVSALIKEGASIESIEKFAYERVQGSRRVHFISTRRPRVCGMRRRFRRNIDCSKIKRCA